MTGTNAGDFSQTNNCPASLGASANCLVNVVFQPTASGTRAASISISDDAADSPQSVTLTGAGTAPAIALSSASVNFGNQTVATASAPVTITVSNSGTGALIINGISFSGANSSDYTETDTCTGSAAANGIAPGATCAIQVTFKPVCSSSAAARAASLSLSDNATGSPQSVPLNRTAIGSFCFVAPAGSSTSATISAGQTANYALQVGPANGFAGAIGFTCAGAPSAATCTASPTTVTVGGRAVANVAVSVATTARSVLGVWRTRRVEVKPRTRRVLWDRIHRGAHFELTILTLLIVIIAIVMRRANSTSRGVQGLAPYPGRACGASPSSERASASSHCVLEPVAAAIALHSLRLRIPGPPRELIRSHLLALRPGGPRNHYRLL